MVIFHSYVPEGTPQNGNLNMETQDWFNVGSLHFGVPLKIAEDSPKSDPITCDGTK